MEVSFSKEIESLRLGAGDTLVPGALRAAAEAAAARGQAAIYLIREILGLSYPEIGKLFAKHQLAMSPLLFVTLLYGIGNLGLELSAVEFQDDEKYKDRNKPGDASHYE